ncbi:hypothetical protein B0I08_101710 [Glaciihabitans tibetensis]|uniref:Uncharacterized protein n=1 Tax=Glaciihabitans tibetensis TaxID=1266600 RepID=A0A2T0VK62_9MICO|nr:hypothetical protein [Glaciihabitans tibetensis]PRY70573.1 hypothetical protein B0I08_101710 [Glaciihabitans tibetensis]
MSTTTENRVFDELVRPPATPVRAVADVLRLLGVLSIAVAVAFVGGTAIPLFALVLLGQLLPRLLGLRPALDLATGAVLLVAGWSNPLDLYRSIPHWDLLVHFAANGLIAVLAYQLFVRFISPVEQGKTVLTTAFGMSAGVIWELGEWFGHTFIDSAVVVEYGDTIGDLSVGALGALVAGLAMPLLTSRPRHPSE